VAQALRIEQLDKQIQARGSIEGQHAFDLRRLIYAKGSVSRSDAEVLFNLNAACRNKGQAFADLYVEALTDYFVWHSEPKGCVTPDLARFLIDNVTADGQIERKTELELALNVVHWARDCPRELVALVLDAVRDSVLAARGAKFGANRPRVCIGAADVAILRKALFAPAGDGGLQVSRCEAEMLFTLNDAAATCENDPEWANFFAHAIANHLTNPSGNFKSVKRDEAAQRERWQDQRGGIGQLLSAVGRAVARGDVPVRAVWEEFDPAGAKAALKDAKAEEEAARASLAREAIGAEEAKWLAERILRDGNIDENESLLLTFLKMEARTIDPALNAVMKRAKL
jgi:hypothetical protein